MKGIRQLIDYFHERAVLTDAQLDYLRAQGFWGDTGAEVYDGSDDEECGDRFAENTNSADAHAPQEPPVRRVRRRTTAKSFPDTLEIARRLDWLMQSWELQNALHDFVGLAQRLQAITTWEQAVIIVRDAERMRLQAALSAAFKARTFTIDTLTQWLVLHKELKQIVAPHERSMAANAYRALLAASDWNAVGKYAWILRNASVRRLFNLLQAQAVVLNALRGLAV